MSDEEGGGTSESDTVLVIEKREDRGKWAEQGGVAVHEDGSDKEQRVR